MVRTVFVMLYLLVILTLLIPFALLLFALNLLIPRYAKFVTYKIAQIWALSVIKLAGCRVAPMGLDNIPRRGPLCIASNHCGIFDIILLLAYIGRPFGFIAKSELIILPIFNMWIVLLGGVFISRKNPRKSLKAINKGSEKMRRGGAMIIFPEGTRSKGRGLLPFKTGALKLATEAEAPILPVAISGSYEVFEKNWRVTPGNAAITFCPLIATKDLPLEDRRTVLTGKVRASIENALG